jgi:hypothetical protein
MFNPDKSGESGVGFLEKDVLTGTACDCGVQEEAIVFVYEETWDWGLHNDLGVLATVRGAGVRCVKCVCDARKEVG